MTQEIIQAIAGFLGRTTLQANEIAAYQACEKALQEAFDAAAVQEVVADGPISTGA